MRSLTRFCLASLLALAPLIGAGAQTVTLPDTLIWEKLDPGPRESSVYSVSFDLDGFLIVSSYDALRWMQDGTWERAFARRLGGLTDYRFEPDGDIYGSNGGALGRTRDNWLTFDEMHDGAETWAITTASGALIVGNGGSGDPIGRSEDDGETWTGHDYPGDPINEPAAPNQGLAFLPPETTGVPSQGRVVAVGISGVGYSDDDGRTWERSELWCPFCVNARNITRLDGGPHEGELVISLDDNRSGGVSAGVWRSADGIAWTRVGQSFPVAVAVEIYPLGDGILIAEWSNDGDLRASEDGGETWRAMGRVDAQDGFRVEDIERGPDGRLYAAVASPPTTYGGTYRTVDPVLPVAAESVAPTSSDLGVRVVPNPSSRGTVTVEVAVAETVEVRAVVVDALGRRVAEVFAGPVAGTRAVEVDTAGWAAGVYAVVVESGGERVVEAFTVVR